MERILLLDALNLFIRSFACINTATEQGNHCGGSWGTLQSLKTITELFHPTKLVFCWEGRHSGKKRREIMPEYKEGRKVKRSLNRTFNWAYPEQEWESFKAQILRLKQYLEMMPIYQVEIDNMEADDSIAYICNNMFKDDNKIIVSSDRDYFQLITDKTCVYRPVKKEIITYDKLITEEKIHPKNWIWMKTLNGDSSDSVPGIVKGLGPKTIIKLFPYLIEPRKINLDEILKTCQDNIEDHRFYKAIYDAQENVEKNWKVMQLSDHDFSLEGVTKINECFEHQKPTLKSFQLRLLFMQDGAMKALSQMDDWNRLFIPLNYREEVTK